MKVPSAASISIILMAGCAASQPHQSKAAIEPPAPSPVSSTASPSRRMSLPYTFTRRGVEVRVNSLESANNQVLVSISLQEMRGQAVDLLVSTLMQVIPSGGQELPYSHYSRAGKDLKEPSIRLEAHDQFSMTLFYQAASGQSLQPLELRFPTGKYWSSNGV